VVAGRSANRGECGQFCRHRFTLQDRNDKILVRDRYLLSLKDFNLSNHLTNLIEAGISSFKIEGRLKDSGYVKNITAYYRQRLDTILEERPFFEKSSSGSCYFTFAPEPARSFNRGFTDYYLVHERSHPGATGSPKSIGQKLGEVSEVTKNYLVIETDEKIANGDGFCFFDSSHELQGFRVNRVEGKRIYPKDVVQLRKGSVIFRNHDVVFEKALQKSEHCRLVNIQMELKEEISNLSLCIVDEDGIDSVTTLSIAKATAESPEKVRAVAERQLKKCGGTGFFPERVIIDFAETSFYSAAVLNELRRLAVEAHRRIRIEHYRGKPRIRAKVCGEDIQLPKRKVSYLDNIKNEKAREFYQRLGLELSDNSPLDPAAVDNCVLMSTRYCLREQLGFCPNQGKAINRHAEPLKIGRASCRERVS
jgi:putative protease